MTRQIGIEIFLMLVIGLALGLFGPFGTFAMAPAMRIAFWMVYMLLGYAIFRPMIVLGQWMSAALSLPSVIGVGLAQAVAAVPLAFMIAWLFAGFDAGRALRWAGLPTLYFQVWLVGFCVFGVFALAFRDRRAIEAGVRASPPRAPAVPDSSAPVRSARLSARLPAGFGPVLALKGEDHYVRVCGEVRDHLLLMRLRDAVAEHDGEGRLVHRSWWVARAGVAGLVRDGRSARLILTNGTSVPVARDALPALRHEGWLLQPPPAGRTVS